MVMENTKRSEVAATALEKTTNVEAKIEYYQNLYAKILMRKQLQIAEEKLSNLEPKEACFLTSDLSNDLKFSFKCEGSVFLSISDPSIVIDLQEFVKAKVAARIAAIDEEILA
jgi:hypothetical protein